MRYTTPHPHPILLPNHHHHHHPWGGYSFPASHAPYRRLWGQQIHGSEGATSEEVSFDLRMVLVSNKLNRNRGCFVWLGAICAGIINWPNSHIYGETCALSSLELFVESRRAAQGSCLNLQRLGTRMMNSEEKSVVGFLMNTR